MAHNRKSDELQNVVWIDVTRFRCRLRCANTTDNQSKRLGLQEPDCTFVLRHELNNVGLHWPGSSPKRTYIHPYGWVTARNSSEFQLGFHGFQYELWTTLTNRIACGSGCVASLCYICATSVLNLCWHLACLSAMETRPQLSNIVRNWMFDLLIGCSLLMDYCWLIFGWQLVTHRLFVEWCLVDD